MTRQAIAAAASLFGLAAAAVAEPPPELAPGATFSLEFLELGPTLANQSGAEKKPATLWVGLPANYDASRKHRLFVYLPGGTGRTGLGKKALKRARGIVGDDDYVVASLSLFRRPIDRTAKYSGLHIGHDDAAVIADAYRAMFARLDEIVPNLAPAGNVIGGTSNGAHTVSALVTAQDGATLGRFDTFVLAEGGFFIEGMYRPSLLGKRFLLLYGGPQGGGSGWWSRTMAEVRVHEGDFYGVDFNAFEMKDVGHGFPRTYDGVVGAWIRGEPVEVIDSQADFAPWTGGNPAAGGS